MLKGGVGSGELILLSLSLSLSFSLSFSRALLLSIFRLSSGVLTMNALTHALTHAHIHNFTQLQLRARALTLTYAGKHHAPILFIVKAKAGQKVEEGKGEVARLLFLSSSSLFVSLSLICDLFLRSPSSYSLSFSSSPSLFYTRCADIISILECAGWPVTQKRLSPPAREMKNIPSLTSSSLFAEEMWEFFCKTYGRK